MLEYQRDRIQLISYTSSSSSYSLSSDQSDSGSKKLKPERVKKFLEGMRGFAPESELDRRLMLGVIERDRPVQLRKE